MEHACRTTQMSYRENTGVFGGMCSACALSLALPPSHPAERSTVHADVSRRTVARPWVCGRSPGSPPTPTDRPTATYLPRSLPRVEGPSTSRPNSPQRPIGVTVRVCPKVSIRNASQRERKRKFFSERRRTVRNRGSYRPGEGPVKDKAFDRKVEGMLKAQAFRLALLETISALKAENRAARKAVHDAPTRPSGRAAWKDRLEANKAASLAASQDADARALLARVTARP